jgi:hypothetical protein
VRKGYAFPANYLETIFAVAGLAAAPSIGQHGDGKPEASRTSSGEAAAALFRLVSVSDPSLVVVTFRDPI